jgi:hypothetical protein
MSFGTTDNNNYQTGGYGGGKSMPSIQQPDFNKPTIPENPNYQGGPPQLDLSGLMPKTPAQNVAESRANGGILKLRQPPQPFNPNPTPNPGFGGGKGLIQPIGGQPGFGGGKSGPMMGLPVERGSFDPETIANDGGNRGQLVGGPAGKPILGRRQAVPMMKNFTG